MTFTATVVRIFIASPGDTADDRRVVRAAIDEWNSEHCETHGVVLIPVGWETDATPEWGAHPQAIINRQLVDVSDLAIGIFWTKMGTPTANSGSGTTEELERFADAGKPVLLYICRRHLDPRDVDQEQFAALRNFEAKIREKVLYDTYSDHAEFKSKLQRALTKTVRDRYSTTSAPHEISRTEPVPQGHRLTTPVAPKELMRLTARLEKFGRKQRIVLGNGGTVAMSQVDLTVPEDVKSLHVITDELPIDILRPGERVELLAMGVMGGGKSIFDIVVSGVGPDGERHSFPNKISI